MAHACVSHASPSESPSQSDLDVRTLPLSLGSSFPRAQRDRSRDGAAGHATEPGTAAPMPGVPVISEGLQRLVPVEQTAPEAERPRWSDQACTLSMHAQKQG